MSQYSTLHNLHQIKGRLLREITHYEQRLAEHGWRCSTPQEKRSLTCFTNSLRKKRAELAKIEEEIKCRGKATPSAS